MYGIFGQFDRNGIRKAEDLSGRRFAVLKHRLSIIDLSLAGHQTMFSADGRDVLVCNGEIYNFRERGSSNFDPQINHERFLKRIRSMLSGKEPGT